MNKFVVSYIIALYNKEEFIIECIDSVLDETNDDILIEICIVDDGSTDNSLELIENRYAKNEAVKISSFKYNKGKNAAYNEAFRMSTGDYICIFGADDIVIKNRTALLLDASISNNCSTYGKLLPFHNKKDKPSLHHDKKPSKSKKQPSFYENIISNKLSGGCSLLKRQHAENIFPIPEHLSFEDWWISYKLLRGGLVQVLDNAVTLYRIHDNNDCAINGDTYSSIKKDYMRHFAYLDEFEKIATTKKEFKMIKKSRALRNAFLGKYNADSILYLSTDIATLKVIMFYLFSSKRLYDTKDAIYRYLKKL